jgi:hypothetical protein
MFTFRTVLIVLPLVSSAIFGVDYRSLIDAKVTDLSLREFLLSDRSGREQRALVRPSLKLVENPNVGLAMYLEWHGLKTAERGVDGVIVQGNRDQLLSVLPDISTMESIEPAFDEFELGDEYRSDSKKFRLRYVLARSGRSFAFLEKLSRENPTLRLYVFPNSPLTTPGSVLRDALTLTMERLGFRLIGEEIRVVSQTKTQVFLVEPNGVVTLANYFELLSLGQGAQSAFHSVQPEADQKCQRPLRWRLPGALRLVPQAEIVR